ncbi:MAG: hypothetical protein N4A54_04225 [Peptostreptococcaceae bacterium]|nr:hypothetical protein [Peptostreptococcaceae bacterium]
MFVKIMIVLIIVMLIMVIMIRRAMEPKEYILVIEDYKSIGKALSIYKEQKHSLPLDLKSLEDYIKKLNYCENSCDKYEFTEDKKGLIIKELTDESIKQLKEIFKSKAYYDKDVNKNSIILYYGDAKRSSIQPKAVIKISPMEIYTTSNINYSSKESITEGREIAKEEWKNKEVRFRDPGKYQIKLRVQDKYGSWSPYAVTEIEVLEKKGIKAIYRTEEDLILLKNNGKVYKATKHLSEDEDGFEYAFEQFEDLDNVREFAFSEEHFYYLKYDGHVYSRGNNESGQLGIDSILNSDEENMVRRLVKIKKISTGLDFGGSVAVDGKLRTWGNNKFGQLGDATNANRLKPVDIDNLMNVRDIDFGEKHCSAIDLRNTAYTWGSNKFGQLGDGSRTDKRIPQTLSIENTKSIACGKDFTLFLNLEGFVLATGNNEFGQLGVGGGNYNKPVQVEGVGHIEQIFANNRISVAIDNRGDLYYWGSFEDQSQPIRKPKKMSCPKSIKFVTIGKYDAYALSSDNTIWAFNKNTDNLEYFAHVNV